MQATLDDWKKCYLNHFVRFFRAPTETEQTAFGGASGPDIQILSFNGVFPGCRVFTSLGLSHFAKEVGNIAELVVPTAAAWEDVPTLMANALFFMVQEGMEIGHGVCIDGLDAINPEFVRKLQKTSLYITTPYGLPEEFSSVTCSGQPGAVFFGIFVSHDESMFFEKYGRDEFEQRLERAQIDPFELGRPSVI